jgi:ubiquinone/menaquinone biosynthesis C-methylase UbiE
MCPQVSADHYDFLEYESEARFSSYYHQVKSLLELKPETVLEIGCGSRTFLSLIKNLGLTAYSVDVDVNLKPTISASVLDLPIKDNSIDVAVAFQVLEHLPFENFYQCLSELYRVSKIGVVISLPDFGNFGVVFSIPYVRRLAFSFHALPFLPKHKFDGEHYWEINKRNYSLKKIISIMNDVGFIDIETYLNSFNPYHRFFVLKKNK